MKRLPELQLDTRKGRKQQHSHQEPKVYSRTIPF